MRFFLAKSLKKNIPHSDKAANYNRIQGKKYENIRTQAFMSVSMSPSRAVRENKRKNFMYQNQGWFAGAGARKGALRKCSPTQMGVMRAHHATISAQISPADQTIAHMYVYKARSEQRSQRFALNQFRVSPTTPRRRAAGEQISSAVSINSSAWIIKIRETDRSLLYGLLSRAPFFADGE